MTEALRDGAEPVAVEAFKHAQAGGHIQDLYKLPQRCAARALMANGLTEAETAVTASVAGLTGAWQPADAGILDKLRSLKVLLGTDSPEVRGWAPAVQQQAQKVVNEAIAALAAAAKPTPAEPVAWRPNVPCTPSQNFNAGKPSAADVSYWQSMGCGIEYAYRAAAPRAFSIPEPGTPWWQTAKDCGAWTDRPDGDVGYVHFGSIEALRVYTVKITKQAQAAQPAPFPEPTPR